MRKRTSNISNGDYVATTQLETYHNIVKKTIQEYTNALMAHCRYRSIVSQTADGTILDDRAKLIDLYESCMTQDAHVQAVTETLMTYMMGERYMLAKQNENGKWERDNEESKKIQGSQFENAIRGIVLAQLFGYSCIELLPDVDEETGLLKEVNLIERRNVLPSQHRIVQRVHQWLPGWNIDDEQYCDNYILIDTGGLGLLSSITPLSLAKKYTLANWTNFSHTYGQPIIHGKTTSESYGDRQRLANDIANAAQKKVLVTGNDDSVDVKTFTMSNSEKIYDSLIQFVNKEISNLVLGSESMAGETQSYVGSTKSHEDIFRARIKTYRRFVENNVNEKILPSLKKWGYIAKDVWFKYSNQVDMSMENKIKLYDMLTDKYEVTPDVIEGDFGVVVGEQFNFARDMSVANMNNGVVDSTPGDGFDDTAGRHMTEGEYIKRYGHKRGEKTNVIEDRVNFLDGVR